MTAKRKTWVCQGNGTSGSIALVAGIATVWNAFIADPAVRDHQELQDVIEHTKDLIF